MFSLLWIAPIFFLAGATVASSSSYLDVLMPKDFIVSRGLNYHYLFTAPRDDDKPYLLFLHGFPSSPFEWRYQIDFFSEQGYGLVVPDMLGFGGTAKPNDTEAFRSSLITRDLIDILDHENVQEVVAIGHDAGSTATARLANYFPDRFLGFAFYSVGYFPPPGQTFEQFEADSLATVGYDQWGYWEFFSREDAADILIANSDSAWSLFFSKDPRIWIFNFSPRGALQAWLESGSTTNISLSQEEYDVSKAAFFDSGREGVSSALRWYSIMTSDIDIADNQGIELANYNLTRPTFFGGALRDSLCVPAIMRAGFFTYASDFTFQDYDSDHWVMIQQHEEVNKDLLDWLHVHVRR